jgi:predicted DNA-binding transcriptional regulator AlpA
MATTNANTISSSFSLLDETEVAEMCHLSVACLRRWRLLRQGPRFMKLGRSVRYSPDDVREFLVINTQGVEHAR